MVDLRRLIDEFFATEFATDNRLITEAIRRMIAAGGKRLRPRLALLSAEAVGDKVHKHLAIASYVELIHVASLIHDDVVDEAERRRGVNATAVDFGNRISVLAGDYLFAWIFKNVTEKYPNPIPHILSATLASICDGEVLQLRSLGDITCSKQSYYQIIEKKTAALFAAAAECGSILGGGTSTHITALTEFGRLCGIAFQIQDDISDLISSTEDLGKPAGHDLIEGKVTLPLLLALEHLPLTAHQIVTAFYSGSRQDPGAVLACIRQGNGVERAISEANTILDQALARLEVLPYERRTLLSEFAEDIRIRELTPSLAPPA